MKTILKHSQRLEQNGYVDFDYGNFRIQIEKEDDDEYCVSFYNLDNGFNEPLEDGGIFKCDLEIEAILISIENLHDNKRYDGSRLKKIDKEIEMMKNCL